MYAEISPKAAKRYSLAEFTDDYGKAQETATVTNVTTGEVPPQPRTGGRQAAADAGQLRHPRLRADLRPRSCFRSTATRSPGPPTSSSRASGPGERLVAKRRVPERAPILARDGTPLAEGPATSRSSPLGAAAQSVAGVVSSPSRQQDRRAVAPRIPAGHPDGDQRPRAGLQPAARRTAGRPAGRGPPPGGAAGRCWPPASRSRASRCTRRSTPHLQQAAVAALGGPTAASRCSTLRNGSVLALAGIALSGPAAARLDLQADHDHRGARRRGGQAHGPVPDPDLDRGRTGARSPTPTTRHAAEASSRRSRSRATASSSRSGRRSARSGSSARRSGTASTRRRASSTSRRLGSWTRPESTIPTSIPNDLELGVTRDRPGPGAGDAAGDGLGRADDRQRRRAEPHADRDGSQAAARRPSPVRVTSEQMATTLRDLMIQRGHERNRHGRGAARGSRWRARPARPSSGRRRSSPARRQPRAWRPSRTLDAWFTAFAPADEPKLVGRGDGRQRQRGRRDRGGSDRAPGPCRRPWCRLTLLARGSPSPGSPPQRRPQAGARCRARLRPSSQSSTGCARVRGRSSVAFWSIRKSTIDPWIGPVGGGGLGLGELVVAAHLAAELEREQAVARDRLELGPLGVHRP